MQSAAPCLEVVAAGQAVRVVPLTATPLRLGRGSACDIRTDAPEISKLHAEIRVSGRGFRLFDVANKAGVYVNGQRIAEHQLVDGDLIELGPQSPLQITFRGIADVLRESSILELTSTGSRPDGEQAAMARLASFFAFSRKLSGAFSLDEVLADIVDLAIECTRAERGMLVRREADDSLRLHTARGRNRMQLDSDGLRVSETLVRKAMAGGAPLVVADAHTEHDLSAVESIVSLELRSAVILPLTRFVANTNETALPEVFGALYLDSRRRRGGLEHLDLRILERLALDTSAAIENARLLREAEEKRRLEQELETARQVQAALMPEQFFTAPGYEIAGHCVPCLDLGGDYVDQFDLGGGRTALVVADICGKGIAASLLAAALQGALVGAIDSGRPIAEVVAHVNRVHSRLAQVGRFATMVLVVLEPDGAALLVDAGHCEVLQVRGAEVTAHTTNGMALGLDADARYEARRIVLQVGDALVLYSDGITECEAPDRTLFGAVRLRSLLAASAAASAAQLLAEITQHTEQFRAGAPVADDVSVIVVRRTGR